MLDRNTLRASAWAAGVGFILWFATASWVGKNEAWDHSLYWVFAYPLALICCVVLGYAHPDRCWRWPLVLFAAQVVAMGVRSGEIGSVLPLGLVAAGVLALPGIAAAQFGARWRRDPDASGTGRR